MIIRNDGDDDINNSTSDATTMFTVPSSYSTPIHFYDVVHLVHLMNVEQRWVKATDLSAKPVSLRHRSA